MLGSKKDDEQEARPHDVHDTWFPNGSRVRNVLVWLDAVDRLAGFQMIATDNSKSPNPASTQDCSDPESGKFCHNAHHDTQFDPIFSHAQPSKPAGD